MKHVIAAAALLLVPAPLAAASIKSATVEAVEGDWSYLPRLYEEQHAELISDAAGKIHRNAISAGCNIEGLNRKQLDMNLPFAAQFQSDGSLKRLVFRRLNCPQVEGVVADLLLKMIEAEELKPTGHNADGWYQGELSFLSVR